MGLKLHYNPLSTFSRRVLIAFAEKQVPHQLVVVDMAARRHREQPYLSLNPYGRVPTLEEDGFVLFKSTAILNYLEATRPAPPLVPADARGRALVDMHMKLCDLQLTRHAGTVIFPKRFLPKERWNSAAMAEAKAEIEKHLAILDKQLAGKTYGCRTVLACRGVLHAIPGFSATNGNHSSDRCGSMERTPARSPERGCYAPREVISRPMQ